VEQVITVLLDHQQLAHVLLDTLDLTLLLRLWSYVLQEPGQLQVHHHAHLLIQVITQHNLQHQLLKVHVEQVSTVMEELLGHMMNHEEQESIP
jgi:hypothetical protein